ncbi:hypothetical protein NCAS_0B08780 [Naumovozyma castellii]|uniref:Nitroreductase domain-containing protein n=1 Tax=Naumovozyma castellii TaxID=27288 RepID=G0VAT5_NAUCA|nr:hypothetical protein NCAS_0B08780 [Naumovozyma castellii CBS 4309]CCC68962.1 hypothetical protein NCAS_0B08780 [Naumovozyma castellii CBS 4309]
MNFVFKFLIVVLLLQKVYQQTNQILLGNMSSTATFLKTLSSRRTVYSLKPALPAGVTINNIQEVVETVVKQTPTAFNSQPNRAIILTGETHKKVWDAVVKNTPAGDAQKRPASERDTAYGTIIFFSDESITKKLQSDFAFYHDIFPVWAAEASGAAQISTWTALETLGLGANLQHYNAAIEAVLPEKIPKNWKIHSQLCFGSVDQAPAEKTFVENKVEIFN